MSEHNILDSRLKTLEYRVSNLEENNREMSKLSTLMEIQVNLNKEQDAFLRDQSATLIKMNENLTSLNLATNRLDNKIETLEDKFIESKIESIKGNSVKDDENHISIPKLIKHILWTVLTAVGVAGMYALFKMVGK